MSFIKCYPFKHQKQMLHNKKQNKAKGKKSSFGNNKEENEYQKRNE